MALKKFIKDPNAKLDYTIDWSAWLESNNDTISAATVPNPPSGLTVVDPVQHTSTLSTVWLEGGTAGSSYDVTVHITTTGGRQDDRTITITCKEL